MVHAAEVEAWFERKALIPYDAILDIDELGDEYVDGPHIYVPFNSISGPFSGYSVSVESADSYVGGAYYPENKDDSRIAKFREDWRAEAPWGPYENPPRKEPEA